MLFKVEVVKEYGEVSCTDPGFQLTEENPVCIVAAITPELKGLAEMGVLTYNLIKQAEYNAILAKKSEEMNESAYNLLVAQLEEEVATGGVVRTITPIGMIMTKEPAGIQPDEVKAQAKTSLQKMQDIKDNLDSTKNEDPKNEDPKKDGE